MSLLINIDTGGTLTDFCVIDGERIHRTKSVTTPFDLSRCLFDGLTKASRELYGAEDLRRMLLATDHIRYSTTQGTNALVERKGPRLGLICLRGLQTADLVREEQSRELYAKLIDDRCATVDTELANAALEQACVAAVNTLAVKGAARLVVSGPADSRGEGERRIKRILLRKFPPHLLGALPVVYGHELVADPDDTRRTWTAIFNAFLHPAMERFLYSAEHRLQEHNIRKPLLIFRNDGGASRVARTSAVKTYSSGPRGGAEALRALAAHYGFERVVGMDVGGTTTDISVVANGQIRTETYGAIEGVRSSLPLCDVTSVGAGGSSIIRIVDGSIKVGPESVGSTPGPACFGFGGTSATITDALLVKGLLDPGTFFGGGLQLDRAAADAAIAAHIGTPLQLELQAAAAQMEDAWVDAIVRSIKATAELPAGTVLVAFGGAGPLLATRIAAAAGVERVLIPALAAVFSAFGVGFSDIEHHFEKVVDPGDEGAIAAARDELLDQVRRAMFAEGVQLSECAVEVTVAQGLIKVRAVKAVPRARLSGEFTARNPGPIEASARRSVSLGTKRRGLPLLSLESLPADIRGTGPAVLEEPYFTALVEEGWTFERSTARDVLLQRFPDGGGRK
ncbi:MAG TPA: hydantoinase/oxoprolinase family protein [Steroidobacteraceae bacterium]|nr:hydantoinase/oxoprolinase family protein [Steroidobacteraceae bacterium]